MESRTSSLRGAVHCNWADDVRDRMKMSKEKDNGRRRWSEAGGRLFYLIEYWLCSQLNPRARKADWSNHWLVLRYRWISAIIARVLPLLREKRAREMYGEQRVF